MNGKKYGNKASFILLLTICFSLFTGYCFAQEKTNITSESLEYNQETFTYNAKGKVKLQKADTLVEADEMKYNEQTSEVFAEGSVKYTTPTTIITASRAELNTEAKTGILYDAEVFFLRDNYHIAGKVIEKRGEKYYFSPDATFTTCDASVPAWCFKGKNIDAVVGDELKARDVFFRIKNVPVFYFPYFLAPILTERKTGFLIPSAGYSNKWGFNLNVPFYWAITENRDVTVSLDYYTIKGLGESLEYRYVEPFNAKGKLWVYHLDDNVLNKDFFELKLLHDQRSADKIGGFLNINYINEKDFYREFINNLQVRTNRFLESTGEVGLPFDNSRLYLSSQYWIDLKEHSSDPPQLLPELGFVLYPKKFDGLLFTANTSVANFWRKEGVYGQRLDIFPQVLHSFGSGVVFSQTLGLRETAYSLHNNDDDNSPHREAIDYSIIANSRFSKKYASFMHIIEPSISYAIIANSENDLPVFDSTELFKKQSIVALSLLNRIIDKDGEILVLRATQGYDTYGGNRPFQPFKLEIGLKRPVSLKLEADYDVYRGNLTVLNSDLNMNISGITFSLNQRYNREQKITYYNAGIGIRPFKPLYLQWGIYYDAEEGKVNETSYNVKYTGQCWATNIIIYNRPNEFSFRVLFELSGLTRSIK